ncbi:XRE family transcriptional regulator [Mesorhizobium sp. M7A.F.Ca.CA.001.09.2.1]|uniref:Helix-turn-helix domain-containing protein n=1 Tax=Mesorhizobium ciceri TaxID=39645 RepID=A0AB38TAU8_9HYPH|nr:MULTISPECIES: helix-turn-helix transcriptional regulator [Mesorhizobium]RUY50206.1 XRE family transcriptional regulator [Mesorhizobium sp. M7A.F.Ca.CA.001.13.2.1]MDF3214839.1 helix-turn-helix transcriptional regulator [Mesorhizobium ciceri]RUY69963.1 XRE family transcriptional regulator [Mesorhizobium sp. M7A.F.Ca.CA.001.05.1.1]RUY71770.1 XRE family transcriptional regulator [Mesorhizobium sp. M7A.F.Ca.CA.001.13.1.1]RUY81299.1 XRE family transcriptional regulator [Mesorhizobium sp. M7A.F.Ca
MNVRKIIGWNLRKLRVERGLSQERLALAAEIDRSYVGRVERGSENVTTDTLEALAKALAVPAAALLTEPPTGAREPSPLSSGRKPKVG